MRIPLDYYRILGLPIQATPEQLRQAHRDRTVQLPRREYSDAAISSRRKLLDKAFAVLSDADQRQQYDASFLAKTYELTPDQAADLDDNRSVVPSQTADLDANTPTIEIQDDEFVGALLLLQELGEYELVLKLGRPFLTGGSASLESGEFGDPRIVYSDIVLTVALACLELGREQWQQGQYENAAEALETGEKLLLREGLFSGVRGEIQGDLYKLRPYRILELLALPESQTEERYRGMQLLQTMLQERGGIDGVGNDYSGLNIDDFLKFIQQLRSYLTAAEQQVLFEEESRRPSAVATYLAVYALLARGFAEHQPALVRRAKLLLSRLVGRQDVNLEQAVCSLLLGQTGEASQALEMSQEYAQIAFIREHSQGAPDLLPGLCLYVEHWLQEEVFPHFRDLARQQVSLKQYFADEQVQAYLEELPNEPEIDADWATVQPAAQPRAFEARGTGLTSSVASSSSSRVQTGTVAMPGYSVRSGTDLGYAEPAVATANRVSRMTAVGSALAEDRDLMQSYGDSGSSQTATATLVSNRSPNSLEADTEHFGAAATAAAVAMPSEERGRRRARRGRGGDDSSRSGGSLRQKGERSEAKKSKLSNLLLPAAVLLGMVALGFLLAWLARSWQTSTSSSSQQEVPLVQLDVPVIDLPTDTTSPAAAEGPLTNEAARQVVEDWLAAKSAAMGPKHDAAALEKVLVDPKLSEWQNASAEAKRDNWYKKYTHSVKVSSVEQDKAKPDEAVVVADVSEATEYFVNGTLQDSTSDPNLQVRYRLIRKDNEWRIQDWTI